MLPRRTFLATLAATAAPRTAAPQAAAGRRSADALRRAGRFFRDRVAVRGGYVYYVSPDLTRRWGEGPATRTQVWVQPPATPTVGRAFLAAHAATGDPDHLHAATAAAEALLYGQLKSGGWTNKIDFDPAGDVAAYRNGRGGGRNFSSLDDGQTQSALRLLIAVDAAGPHAAVREGARFGLNALLAAQFPGGGFPQAFDGPAPARPAPRAVLPPGDWRALPRVKAYWSLPTLNDGLAGQVADTLLAARDRFGADDPALAARCGDAARRLGEFLLRSRLPDPQPGWAQQYDGAMRPAWARAFEPPAVATRESQDAVRTLLVLHAATGEARFLHPIPAALDYLDRVALPDGRLPRYVELNADRPLYVTRDGRGYRPTDDDADLPRHYGWKVASRTSELRARLARARAGEPDPPPDPAAVAAAARRAAETLDGRGRWVSVADGARLVGQPEFPPGTRYLAGAAFAANMTALADHLRLTA